MPRDGVLHFILHPLMSKMSLSFVRNTKKEGKADFEVILK